MPTSVDKPSKRHSRADVPGDRLADLQAGVAQTRDLVEILCIDFAALFRNLWPDLGEAASLLESCRAAGITRRMQVAGQILLDSLDPVARAAVLHHPSDTVRGWYAYSVAAEPDLSLTDRLALIRPLADDLHMGVREWAWLAVRPQLAAALPEAIARLTPWTAEASERLRRFAVESLRPRGVWCSHIPALKEDPAIGLPLIAPLKADPAKYVQDSVGNWLNDAGKTCPGFVRDVCARWRRESACPATERIVRRALRSL